MPPFSESIFRFSLSVNASFLLIALQIFGELTHLRERWLVSPEAPNISWDPHLSSSLLPFILRVSLVIFISTTESI
ncbi:hypothetical protein DFH09DRAFT_1119925 [Mycena vulgaris]|nr:hypothetical protein DFH09DRAFT_1119925 [Mycena vulgaris]